MLLDGFGEAGQQKLRQAKVLVIGAGGLGCPALQYLAAAGVGTIGVVDGDTVSLGNLHRQVLYATADVGLPKATCAKMRLQALNPEIEVVAFNRRLDARNALDIIAGFDVVIDGADNFSTRYLVNDACVLLGKTLVYGAVSRFEGQLAVFNYPGDGEAVNYRDLFPQPPAQGEVPDCAEAGVLGVLPGVIGAMQAGEAIKIITGIGRVQANRLLTFDALRNTFYEVTLTPRPGSAALIPKDAESLRQTDYERLCGVKDLRFVIDSARLDALLQTKRVDVIDVREFHETPALGGLGHRRIPLSEWHDRPPAPLHDTVVVVCQSGARSLQAAKRLAEFFGASKTVYSLQGGVVEWHSHLKNDPANGEKK